MNIESGPLEDCHGTVAGDVESGARWTEAGLVCQACAGDAPGGKCRNPKCVGGPVVRELAPAAGVAPSHGGEQV